MLLTFFPTTYLARPKTARANERNPDPHLSAEQQPLETGSKYVVATNRHVSARRSDGVDRLLNGHPGSRQGTIVERGRLGGRRWKHRDRSDQLPVHETNRETASKSAGHR